MSLIRILSQIKQIQKALLRKNRKKPTATVMTMTVARTGTVMDMDLMKIITVLMMNEDIIVL